MFTKRLSWQRSILRSLSRLPQSILLMVEELEPRWVPNAYLWNPISKVDTYYQWNTVRNWDLIVNSETAPASAVPGPGDSALFQSPIGGTNANKDCYVNAGVTVGTVTLNGYKWSLLLGGSFTVGSLTMNVAGNVAGENNPAIVGNTSGLGNANGKLIITKQFVWNSGTLKVLPVQVDSGATMTVGQIKPNAATQLNMINAQLNINGNLIWANCNVSTSGSNTIQINKTGTFTITASDYTWGGSSSNLSVSNEGTVNMNSTGKATLNASFTNSLLTNINSGTLVIGGPAVQDTYIANFNLNSGTVQLINGSNVLNINAGTIQGNGTIDGNLTLGLPAGLPATIIPGGKAAVGSITVNGDFNIIYGNMLIYIVSGTQYG
jgi:hypothetical protein